MADNENVEFSGPTPPCSSTTANTSKRAASWQTELRRYLAERVGQPVPAFEIYKRILVPPWVSWRFWCRRHRGVNFEPTLVTVTWERISAVLLEYPLEYDPPRRRRRTLQGNSLITPLQRPCAQCGSPFFAKVKQRCCSRACGKLLGKREAIPVCHDLDEVKDYHDQAVALAEHKRQANDEEARRQFNEIRLRAKRRMGQMEKARGGGDQRSDRRSRRATGGGKTLRELGITKSESSLSQQLAQVPDAVFEERLKKPKPTTSSIIEPDKATQRAWEKQQAKRQQRKLDRLQPQAAALCQMLRTFSISGLPFSDPNDVLAALESGDALPGAREIAGDLAGWLAELRAPETGANTSTTDTKVAP